MDIFSIFFNIKVCCVFSLKSPHRGDSNEYTQYTIKKDNHPKLSQICSHGIFSKGLKNEFETVVLKVYCKLFDISETVRQNSVLVCYENDPH